MKEIRTRSEIDATVQLPGSKSMTHRALIASSLSEGKSVLTGVLTCEDTDYTRRSLLEMGVPIEEKEGALEVEGTGGTFPAAGPAVLFLGNSGTSMRLLLGTAALSGNEYVLDGSPRMRQRPIGELVSALNKIGAKIDCLGAEGFPPLLIKGKRPLGGKVRLSGGVSSQYLSSLLLIGPCLQSGLEIEVRGDLVSSAYVDLTIQVVEAFGAHVSRQGYKRFYVRPGQAYRARRYAIEADASNASYFWAASAVTGGRVATENIDPFATRQGDIRFLNLLEQMGCAVKREAGRVAVEGGPLRGVDADMSAMPDLVPTLAAAALFAEGKTVIRNVPHLRHKESDRLKCIGLEWSKLGGRVEELPDGLIVHGGKRLRGTVSDPHDDHRLAMSLAVIGLRAPGVKISGENCVRKSFPGFWALWENL